MKHGTRNKSETDKEKSRNDGLRGGEPRIRHFFFLNLDLFRISCFGFRAFTLSLSPCPFSLTRQHSFQPCDAEQMGGPVPEVDQAEVAAGDEQGPAEQDEAGEGGGRGLPDLVEIDDDRLGVGATRGDLGDAAGVAVRQRRRRARSRSPCPSRELYRSGIRSWRAPLRTGSGE